MFFSEELGYYVVTRHVGRPRDLQAAEGPRSENTQAPYKPRPAEVEAGPRRGQLPRLRGPVGPPAAGAHAPAGFHRQGVHAAPRRGAGAADPRVDDGDARSLRAAGARLTSSPRSPRAAGAGDLPAARDPRRGRPAREGVGGQPRLPELRRRGGGGAGRTRREPGALLALLPGADRGAPARTAGRSAVGPRADRRRRSRSTRWPGSSTAADRRPRDDQRAARRGIKELLTQRERWLELCERPVDDPERGRGAAAARHAGLRLEAREGGGRDRRRSRCPRAPTCCCCSARPTTTRRSSPTPRASTCNARTPAPTSRSATASTSASAPRWRGWRRASCSRS